MVTLGARSFSGAAIGTVVLPDSVTSVKSFAFLSAEINTVRFGKNIASIGDLSFEGCFNLIAIYFEGNAPASVGGGIFAGVTSEAKVYVNNTATGFQTTFADLPVVRIDMTPPVITLSGETSVNHELETPYTDAGATASDSVDGSVSVTTSGEVDEDTSGTYTLTYNASDAAGNAATPVTRTVVVSDRAAPVITLLGEASVSHQVGTPYTDAGADATDSLDGNVSVTTTGEVDEDTFGTYTLTYNASDAAGNAATPVTRTVMVSDRTAPVITLSGEASVNHELGVPYTDAGATATDSVDGSVPVTRSGEVDVNTSGTYTLTYNASDAADNAATPVTRTVEIISDITPPVITLLGEARAKHQVGYPYKDAGANATDNIDGNVPVTKSGEVNVNQIGTYTLTYRASDDFGNKAKEVSREIMVVADALPPVITLVGEATVSHKERDYYQDFGATALDESDGTVNVRTIGGVNIQTPGVYTLTYNARDTAGNAATPVTRTVEVVSSAIMNAHENMTFVTNGAKVTVTHCEKDARGVLEIPETYMGNAVTSIGNNAFENCMKLTGVSIPGSLAAIGDRAFLGCAELREINFTGDHDYIEEGLVIGSHAFDSCSKLASFVLPEYTFVQNIGNYAFQDCSELTVYHSYFGYDDEGLTLGVGAFQRCSKLVSFPFIDLFGNIGAEAFRGCNSLRKVEFAEGLGSFGHSAFRECTGLVEINFAPTIEVIPNFAFAGCTSLEEINLAYITRVNWGAFNDCKRLSRIYFETSEAPELYYRTDQINDRGVFKVKGFDNISADAKVYVIGGTKADKFNFWLYPRLTKGYSSTTQFVEWNRDLWKWTDTFCGGLEVIRPDPDDKTPPEIVLIGDAFITINLGQNFKDQGANVIDNVDPNRSIYSWDTVDTSRKGSYSLPYYAQDFANNYATSKTRTVYVVDKISPSITLNGTAKVSIEAGEGYVDAGALAKDNYDTELTVRTSGEVNAKLPGTYTLTYKAVDES